MHTTSYIHLNRLLKAIRKKVADALWHERQNDSSAASAIRGYTASDYDELKRAWAESVGGAVPSNLGRHIHFWKEQDFHDILRMDIPEIDAALDNWLGAATETSTPTELTELLHPAVLKHGYPQFRSGNLREAVLNSFIAVFDMIRARTGRDDDGERLITGVFSERNPWLIFSDLETASGRDDQVGFMQIIQGSYRGVRNPNAHTLDHDLTPHSAAQFLVFASLLARRVESAVSRNPTTGSGG